MASRRGKKPSQVKKPRTRTSSVGTRSKSVKATSPALRPDSRFPIVGLGASAGGLDALETFFTAMPADSGMGFVVVTHQHAGHTSLLAELLSRRTTMPVSELSKASAVRPNHVYTVTPGYHVSITGGVLQPVQIDRRRLTPMPIDYFFRSLAADQQDRAIGIILSGTGTDGSIGLKEIKGGLGLVVVQEEQSAQYAGMPHSAIATELVDFVLPVAEMPKQLLSYASAARGRSKKIVRGEPTAPEALQQIFALVRERTGHDFSQYKGSTIRRRIERRMNLHHLDSVRRYVRFLQNTPTEVDLLFKELLIGVTSFFRDPDAWKAVASSVEALLVDKPDDYVFRIWVPGCSSGEEAYSLAMLLREVMDASKRSMSLQIFATDLDTAAIEMARAGSYPLGISNDVNPKRLTRFFIREDESYRVKKEIREMLIFAPQNLVADPPFTKLDLVSCRNLLIYLDATLQRRIVPIFHYALKPGGVLFLGSSESIGAFTDLFAPLDKKHKIFARQDVAGAYVAEFSPRVESNLPNSTRPTVQRGPSEANTIHLAEKFLLKNLVPPTVLVQERGDVVHVHGRTGLFLEPAPGAQASANIFNMARRGLQVTLSAAMRQAASQDREIVHRGIQVKTNGSQLLVDLRVQRLKEPDALKGLYRITFEESSAGSPNDEGEETAFEMKQPDRLAELERELQYTKESHQGTIEELETTNEELKSTNEEMQSTNEELQSANEELETSKEEMQSLNEELQTVNAELQGKVEELSRANNDMKNLLNGTDIATLFLDNDLNIKRYTEQAKRVARLIPSDVGRPIGDIVSRLRDSSLIDDAKEVLRTLAFKETEVQSEGDAWYLMRVLPYRTTENVIDGLVITFVDITKIRALQEGQRRLLDALKSSPTSVFGQDAELRYRWGSSSVFAHDFADVHGQTDLEVFGPTTGKELTELKTRVMQSGSPIRQRIAVKARKRSRTYDVYVEATIGRRALRGRDLRGYGRHAGRGGSR